ncbi:MAG: archaeal flagellar protein FlaJ [Thermoplasmata archaeon]|jgi:flagellar protein FlaJ|nr:archaeal flagellar protein FlaJ [Thermoplasmata archaeon]
MTNPFRRISSLWLRAFEPVVATTSGSKATARALRAARIGTFPEAYIATSYLVSGLIALAMGVVTWIAMVRGARLSDHQLLRGGVAVAAAGLAFALARLGFLAYPRLVSTGRARRIDAEMPSVVTLCYALAQGNVPALDIIRTVAAEKATYGEAAIEFRVVVRNVEWLGLDLISALEDAADTTPSPRLAAFFRGLVTMLNSGADAKDYFMHQAKSELQAEDMALERDLESASMLAEIYVSGLLVLPLLLMVVISGLAPLAGGQTALIPFIIFGFIPLGTIVYLILVDTLLPPESLTVPKTDPPALADFGLAHVLPDTHLLPPPWQTSWPTNLPEGAGDEARAAARRLRWQITLERTRLKMVAGWRHFVARMLARPVDAIEFSGFIGLAVLVGGLGIAWWQGLRSNDFAVAATGVLITAAVLTAIPISAFHEIRVRRARRVEATLPDNLTKLAGFNERGIGLLQSFEILGESATGPLAKEFKAVERDVSWNGSLANALRRLRERVNTLRMTKLGILLERASNATGSMREVLDIAANDATKRESIRATRRQSMMSYVIVIYIVFAVFLYVLYMVAHLFYGAGGLGAVTAKSGGSLSAGLDPTTARVLFAQAAVIQGVFCGMVAGRLGEGHTLSGLKHAALLAAIAYIVFLVGVLS